MFTAPNLYYKIGSVESVRRNVQIKIVHLKTRCVLSLNKIGELLGKLLTMMMAYHNNPQATKAAIDDYGKEKEREYYLFLKLV